MTPSEFTFKLTVPNDPQGATVAAAVATHAVEYAGIEAGAGAAFVERVRGTLAQALKSASGTHTPVVFAASGGTLTVTFGAQSVSEPLPS